MSGCFKTFLIICCIAYCSFVQADTITDDLGNSFSTDQKIERIISLAPDITEILYAIGAGSKVIGVIQGSNYPIAVKKLQTVGAYNGLDLERIVDLHPDLIVVWGNTFSRQLAVLEELGMPFYTTKPRRIEDVARTMRNLGRLVHCEKTANAAAENFLNRYAILKNKYQHQKNVSVFYQIGAYALFTVNKESWINQVIEACGGRNIFAAAKFISPEVGIEAIVAAKPQVIITDALTPDWRNRYASLTVIPAVKAKHLYAIPPDLIDRAGPRLINGLEQVCYYLDKARTTLRDGRYAASSGRTYFLRSP